jgi:uncharacterized membrane protein
MMNHLSKIAPFAGPAFALFNFANAQGYHRGHPGWSLFEGLLQLLFLVLIVLGIIWLVRVLRSQGTPSGTLGSSVSPDSGVQGVFNTFAPKPAQDSALQILRERLAKGEIDPEDYEARRRVLTEH